MKILFISSGHQPDYQSDMVLHGLRSLYGADVVDSPRVAFLYNDYCDPSSLYGRGFSLYGILPDIEVDRANIKERIAKKEFDLIVYGSIQRCQDYFDQVVSTYPRQKIIFIDGEDHPNLFNLSKHGLYFKRELEHSIPGIYPIYFAIPTVKVGTIRPVIKNQVRAKSDPRDRSTYTFTDEISYYTDYSRSLFAFTMKKAGWDSLRHAEILANGAIPLFLDLDQCPPLTCTQLPKPELLEALTFADRDGTFWDTQPGKAQWQSLWRRIHMKWVVKGTTEMLAQYLIETQRQA